ncbi:hypothetical protein IAQ61_011264 [Plenodomus lingam]|uniref:uncharacterized protein n=1 Tax=Leptosphaeria maculans TaxID=5022 RepID=UPI00332CD07F|nr:hypothetical protein IAQ61_011264 [Plenodomus lingam]
MPTPGVSYAAVVSRPSGTHRQPEAKAQISTDYGSRASLGGPTRSQRPGIETQSGTLSHDWPNKAVRSEEKTSAYQPGPTGEVERSRDEHKPKTEHGEELVYVLTVKISNSLARPMNQMRKQHFPKRLNHIPAHLTLFHALPHSQLAMIEQGLSQMSLSIQPFAVSTGKPFRMRKGIGVNVDVGYNKLKHVHCQLQSQWEPFLSEQDAGGFRPHWTVMNKVDDGERVKSAFETIGKELSRRREEGSALGLDLWRYNGGKWEWTREFTFGQGASPTQTA